MFQVCRIFWNKMNTTNIQIILNTLRPRQDGRHFADDIFKCLFLNENVWIPIKISLKFVPTGPINNIPAMVQIMAWRRPGDKPLSEPMVVSLPTHICVARPQWVKPQNRLVEDDPCNHITSMTPCTYTICKRSFDKYSKSIWVPLTIWMTIFTWIFQIIKTA